MHITNSSYSSSIINHHKPPWHPLEPPFPKPPKDEKSTSFHQLDLTQDDTKTPSPKHQLSSPSAPNVPSKIPSTKYTSSSSIDYIPKSLTLSTSSSPNGYLNSPTHENASMDITLTLSPITPLDVQFNSPSPFPPIFGHPIPWNLLEAHGDSCLCCIPNRTLIFGLRDELQYMFSYIERMLSQSPFSNTPTPSISPN
ncbi:hypothetical protein Tco_1060854 [Tanacetum coccineum]